MTAALMLSSEVRVMDAGWTDIALRSTDEAKPGAHYKLFAAIAH